MFVRMEGMRLGEVKTCAPQRSSSSLRSTRGSASRAGEGLAYQQLESFLFVFIFLLFSPFASLVSAPQSAGLSLVVAKEQCSFPLNTIKTLALNHIDRIRFPSKQSSPFLFFFLLFSVNVKFFSPNNSV